MSTPSEKEKSVPIELTPEQEEQVMSSTGKAPEAIELSSTELEERIAPRIRLRP
ncbi:hypothetical protein [Gemmatimonas phototrophica]|nr:hypothetical protein [Gemmatimonas phototrophica]